MKRGICIEIRGSAMKTAKFFQMWLDEGQQIVKKICAMVLTKPMDGVKYKTTKSQERSS